LITFDQLSGSLSVCRAVDACVRLDTADVAVSRNASLDVTVWTAESDASVPMMCLVIQSLELVNHALITTVCRTRRLVYIQLTVVTIADITLSIGR